MGAVGKSGIGKIFGGKVLVVLHFEVIVHISTEGSQKVYSGTPDLDWR